LLRLSPAQLRVSPADGMLRFFKFLINGYGPVANTGSTARDHLANERTYLAWTRSSLALIALGIGLERFETLRQDIISLPQAAAIASPLSSPPSPTSATTLSAPTGTASSPFDLFNTFANLSSNRKISLILTTTGAVTAATSVSRYYSVLHELQRNSFTPNVRGVFLISAACFGVFGAVLSSEVQGYRGGLGPLNHGRRTSR
jgi:uncharacterized membrane protein YidH (DUF202 family)